MIAEGHAGGGVAARVQGLWSSRKWVLFSEVKRRSRDRTWNEWIVECKAAGYVIAVLGL